MAEKINTNQTATPGAGVEQDIQKQNADQAIVIEDLKKKIVELESLNEGHLHEINQHKSTIETLEKVISEYDGESTKKDEMINTLNAELANLSSELSEVQKSAEQGYQVVKSGKKNYRVYGKKFLYKGREHSIEDLQKDQNLVNELIALEVGFLQEIKEEKED